MCLIPAPIHLMGCVSFHSPKRKRRKRPIKKPFNQKQKAQTLQPNKVIQSQIFKPQKGFCTYPPPLCIYVSPPARGKQHVTLAVIVATTLTIQLCFHICHNNSYVILTVADLGEGPGGSGPSPQFQTKIKARRPKAPRSFHRPEKQGENKTPLTRRSGSATY